MPRYQFFDMSSGGVDKLPNGQTSWEVNATSEKDAIAKFKAKWGHDPLNITCECCGPDFWINEEGP